MTKKIINIGPIFFLYRIEIEEETLEKAKQIQKELKELNDKYEYDFQSSKKLEGAYSRTPLLTITDDWIGIEVSWEEGKRLISPYSLSLDELDDVWFGFELLSYELDEVIDEFGDVFTEEEEKEFRKKRKELKKKGNPNRER